MKLTGKLSEIPNKVKAKEEQFKETLKTYPFLFDAEFAISTGMKRFDLSQGRSLQIFKETLKK